VLVGSRTEMAGGALPFNYDTSEAVLAALERGRKEADTEDLRAAAFLFTNIWLDDLLQKTLNPTLPQMCNTDGDELEFTKVSYPLQPGATADGIRLALARVPALRPESETFWNWIAPQKPATKKRRADGLTFMTTLDDGSLALGTVELKGKMLVLEANSQ